MIFGPNAPGERKFKIEKARSNKWVRWLAVGCIVALLIGLGLFRLSVKPIRVAFLTPQIERVMSSMTGGLKVHISDCEVAWKNFLIVRLKDVKIYHQLHDSSLPASALIFHAPYTDLSMSFLGFLRGRWNIEEVMLNKPKIDLAVFKDVLFQSTAKGKDKTNFNQDKLLAMILAIDEGWQKNTLRRLTITDGVIFHKDSKEKEAGISHVLYFSRISLEHHKQAREILLNGSSEVSTSDDIFSIRLFLEDRLDKKEKYLEASIKNLNPHRLLKDLENLGLAEGDIAERAGLEVKARLHGRLSLVVEQDSYSLKEVQLDLAAEEGFISVALLYPYPLPVKKALIKGRGTGETIHIEQLDIQTAEPKVHLRGVIEKEAPQKWLVNLEGKLSDLPVAHFKEYWPASMGTKARNWVLSHISKGKVTAASLNLKGVWSFGQKSNLKAFSVQDISGHIDVKDTQVEYLTGLPKVTKVDAHIAYTRSQLDIKLLKGRIAEVALKSGTVTLSGLKHGQEKASLSLAIKGPLRQILKIIDHSPLVYATQLGIQADRVHGQALVDLQLNFPLMLNLTLSQVGVEVGAELQNVRLENFMNVSNRPLSVAADNLSLSLTKDRMVIEGAAEVSSIPTTFKWVEYFSENASKKRELFCQGSADSTVLKKVTDIDMLSHFQGPMGYSVDYSVSRDGAFSVLKASLNFAQIHVHLPWLGWTHKVGEEAILTADINMPKGGDLDIVSCIMKGAGLSFEGSGQLKSEDLHVRHLKLKSFKMPFSDFSLRLKYQDGMYVIGVKGEKLDIGPWWSAYFKDKASSLSAPFNLNCELNSLYFGPGKEFHHTKAHIVRNATKEWGPVNISAKLNGKEDFSLNYGPKNQKNEYALSIKTTNCGLLFKILDFTTSIVDGKLEAVGVKRAKQPLSVKAKVTTFRIKDAPILTRILSITSPKGLADLLSGQGIFFDLFKGNINIDSHTLSLANARAISVGLGITLEGQYNLDKKMLNFKGGVIPAYLLNAMISHIPLIGQLLGGVQESGLLSFRYRVTGSINKPKVSVNPISVLTPGILGEIMNQ